MGVDAKWGRFPICPEMSRFVPVCPLLSFLAPGTGINRDKRGQTQRALRDRLMSRGKNCLPTVSRQFLTHNYPRPNCLLKCLPNCLSPTREGFLSSFKINPAVRVIARQVRDINCLAAIFAPRHQSVSSGPLGTGTKRDISGQMGKRPHLASTPI